MTPVVRIVETRRGEVIRENRMLARDILDYAMQRFPDDVVWTSKALDLEDLLSLLSKKESNPGREEYTTYHIEGGDEMIGYKHDIRYNPDAVNPPRSFLALWREDADRGEVGVDFYFEEYAPHRIVETYRWTDGNGLDEDEVAEVKTLAQRLIDSYYSQG